ncbi:hypothetical protein [Methylocystis sp.]|uniref:hypothetical protein n=1 Tax=Methylocystis sp. TaxID=1911079 RepID=UPI003DA6A4B9
MTKQMSRADNEQSKAFVKAARELGIDADPERFKEMVRKVVTHKGPAMKQHKTAEQLGVLVTEYVEKRYRGEMSGTQVWRVVKLDVPNDGSNWKIAHSGHGAGFGNALDEAERHLRKQFDLVDG